MSPNTRTFWPIEQFAVKANTAPATNQVARFNSKNFATGVMASGVDQVLNRWEVFRGIQSVGNTTTFNLEEVFQLGQVEVYEQSERQPEVEFTVQKFIEGSKPLYFSSLNPSGGNNIVNRANFRVDLCMGIWSDTQFRANLQSPVTAVVGSGMFVSNLVYTFNVDGPVTEEVTYIGNDKIWAVFDTGISGLDESTVSFPPSVSFEAPVGIPSGVFGYEANPFYPDKQDASESAGPPDAAGIVVVGSGIQRREDVDIRRSVLPSDIPGVTTFSSSGLYGGYLGGIGGTQGPGTAPLQNVTVGDANTDYIIEKLQTVTCSIDLGRDDLFELGRKRPFSRIVSFPAEVSCSIEVITSEGDLVDARSLDYADNTVANNTIVIRTLDGMQVDLGDRNRLESVDMGGGEAGGDSMTITYNYVSFNTFNVTHDTFEPNHRIIIFETETGDSRFNQGAPSYKRSDFGV